MVSASLRTKFSSDLHFRAEGRTDEHVIEGPAGQAVFVERGAELDVVQGLVLDHDVRGTDSVRLGFLLLAGYSDLNVGSNSRTESSETLSVPPVPQAGS